mmetsp:Transcript_14689/g.34862  ORF Transcript_14689/g.34862 Transcript_14689/m.34862 type:complete len:350 (-) Transcript_14689:12-1061(-)
MFFILNKSVIKVSGLDRKFFSKKKRTGKKLVRFSCFSFNSNKKKNFPFEKVKIFVPPFLSIPSPLSRDIFWFRFDLRLKDNSCLEAALNGSHPPILVFCTDSENFTQFGKKRKKFFIESLNDIKNQLQLKNIFFMTFNELPGEVFPWLINKFNSKSIFYSINPFSEKKIQSHEFLIREFKKAGATSRIFVGNSTIYPKNCYFEKNHYFSTFSNFLNYFKAEKGCGNLLDPLKVKIYQTLPGSDSKNSSLAFQKKILKPKKFFIGGETCILSILKKIHKSQNFRKTFDYKNILRTFRPWIDFGCITPKTLISFLIQKDLVCVRILIFNFFLNDFDFLIRQFFQEKNFVSS